MSSDDQKIKPVDKIDLRHMFIAMLFAFSIENVFSTVFTYTFGEKSGSLSLLTVMLHTIFMVFVITSSWLKWSESSKDVSLENEKKYLILTIDILILFMYFLMVKFIAKDIQYLLIANVTMAFLYLLWDFVWNDVKLNNIETIEIEFNIYGASLYFLMASILLLCVNYYGFVHREILQAFLIVFVVFYRYIKGAMKA